MFILLREFVCYSFSLYFISPSSLFIEICCKQFTVVLEYLMNDTGSHWGLCLLLYCHQRINLPWNSSLCTWHRSSCCSPTWNNSALASIWQVDNVYMTMYQYNTSITIWQVNNVYMTIYQYIIFLNTLHRSGQLKCWSLNLSHGISKVS